ncbi:outer membrane immunogenic protein [Xanthobacter flavus]|uniref:Outer-membrane immunogenic protein n=1 Tax=Xanthobacter flavus TaxID=281 RepID=A0A9W6CRD3_XANFL|nr:MULTISPECIES: outer membrane protein [Xanthobacter]MDR6336137.1 outer membrane immunogenic protein [Xanthobacter flavus]NMN60637.1 outer membrane immunogenic protein [Xanthobacter sp. SG618]GLI24837.1 outer-membrane immunogenic protein [Xanthobacter flavus]
MKRFLLATVALAALSAPAAAADLATKYPVKAVAVVPVFSWTGFYIGGNVGYGGDSFTYDVNYFGSPVASASLNSSGFYAGGQIGYNYQFANNVVLGIETDLQWSNIAGNVSASVLGLPVVSAGTTIDYFGTIRARLGYAIDRFLPYITGGVAYGKTATSASVLGVQVFDKSSTNWGWTIGAGGEFAITNNWTFKAEYLYVDLGSASVDAVAIAPGLSASTDSKFNSFRAGVNYKF